MIGPGGRANRRRALIAQRNISAIHNVQRRGENNRAVIVMALLRFCNIRQFIIIIYIIKFIKS